ncbi:MAG: type II toxin-antitoxin system VapC family toxin [Desulfuromonadales bacterium]
MKPTVYIETTIPSYLAARLSTNIITAGQQILTHEWWEQERQKYRLYVSQAVLDECGGGNAEQAKKRLTLIRTFSLLPINDAVAELSAGYMNLLGIPPSSAMDAIHLAVSVVHRIDYLLTWNCRHLAHGETRMKLHRHNTTNGLHEPIIVTPQELEGRYDVS